mmetsp:Transcript_158979/g.296325  ORF Transcript_158979/g.296325 Transcript_158979/m.296325 type:complete len:84 (-) Transcript_158979:311-562(-)
MKMGCLYRIALLLRIVNGAPLALTRVAWLMMMVAPISVRAARRDSTNHSLAKPLASLVPLGRTQTALGMQIANVVMWAVFKKR